MIDEVRTLKTLADETRLRILLLLREKELFVCPGLQTDPRWGSSYHGT